MITVCDLEALLRLADETQAAFGRLAEALAATAPAWKGMANALDRFRGRTQYLRRYRRRGRAMARR